MPIDKAKLEEIDSELDDSIKEFDLLKVSRDKAINSILKYYEEYVTLEATAASGNITGHNILSKQAQDGIDFAIQWIFKYCPVNSGSTPNQNTLKTSAKNLLEQAQEYSRVWDFMNLLFRDMCKAELNDEKTIIVEYKDDYRSEADIANRFLNEVDDVDSMMNELSKFFESDPLQIINEIGFEVSRNNELQYTIPDSVYIEIYKFNLDAKKHLLELNEDWDLGGYKVRDLTHFFNYLRTISMIHMMGCMFASGQGKIVNNPFIIKSEDQWIRDIKENITIGDDECRKIFTEITYDYTLYEENKKNPDVTYQPFIPFTNGNIALFNSLVQQSNYERNHWDLLSIIKPELHSQLRNEKESLWLDELKKFCSEINLETKEPFEFTYSNRNSNLDLTLIDRDKKVILIIELKWITNPDRIKDIVYLSKELDKGLNQVEFALEWINNTKSQFAEKIGINVDDLTGFNIYGLVLSKNSMGNGFTYKENIPIINERIFKWVLSAPHNKDIGALWKVGKEKRFMPKVDVHFTHGNFDAFFAGYKFIGKGIGMYMIRPFNQNTDFNFEGL